MADIRYQALNAAGVNVAEINGHTIDSKTGGEVAIGAGFILGISTGVVQIAIKATSVVPVIGHSVDMLSLHLSQEEFPVGFSHNGKTYVFPAKCTEYSMKNEAKNGMTTGDITITQAGPAQAIG
jgi:hypothetical protein